MYHKKYLRNTAAGLAFGLLLTAGAAHAAKITGVGNASVDDVTLGGGAIADLLAYSGQNPAAGSAGNSSGFSSAFSGDQYGTGGWSLLGKVEGNKISDVGSDLFSFNFSQGNGKSGTWSITNNSSSKDVLLDLTFAMHASNASTAFLFDEQTILAGQTVQGTWRIEWLKSGNIPGFSNLALFAREVSYLVPAPAASLPGTPVPEPASWAMMLTGLGLVGFFWRRRATAPALPFKAI